MKLLLVEDNENIIKGLKYSLEQNHYEVITALSKKEALDKLKHTSYELLILDITLPDGDGFTLYQEIKKTKNIPTIFLTAKDEEDDIVTGLELGADDYITKPFSTRELLARINKIVAKTKKSNQVTVQDITFDLDKMEVYKKDRQVTLTSLELRILALLFTSLNKVVSRNFIIDKIWDWTGNDVNDNTVTVYLKRIREKLGTNIITTIKGIGYRIDEDEK